MRARIEAKWSSSDSVINDRLKRVEKAISSLVSRSYDLGMEPGATVDGRGTPDLEGPPASGPGGGGPPSPPPAAALAGDPSALRIEPSDDFASEEWSSQTELLYDDVLYLFQSGDLDGALVSLERLLLLAGRNPEVLEFVRLNEDKLVRLYERSLGSFERMPKRERRVEAMPLSFLSRPSVAMVYNHVNGERSITSLIDALELPRVEICSVLNQLRRSRLISCDAN